jgi:hypothetical protein
MCLDPMTAMTALSIGSSLLGYANDYENAQDSYDEIEKDHYAQQAAILEQQKQITANATDKMTDRAKEAMIERGRLRAIQGESGLSGNTQDRIMRESYFNEGTDISAIEGNRKSAIKQSKLDAEGLRASNQSRINSVKQPSLIGAGLQIGTAIALDKQSRKTA